MSQDQIQKEWESYLRDRTVSIDYYESVTKGCFSTAQPYKIVLTSEKPNSHGTNDASRDAEVAAGLRLHGRGPQ